MNHNHATRPVRPFCTLTGIDDTVAFEELEGLSREYPFVEWGVLCSQSRQGAGRYPSFAKIEEWSNRIQQRGSQHFALHLCGREVIREFLAGTGRVMRMAAGFNRVQINFRYDPMDLPALRDMLDREHARTIITQHNNANQSLWRSLLDKPNHAVLFDESGGRGKTRNGWPAPLSAASENLPFDALDPICGYAGGLGPASLWTALPQIKDAAHGSSFWINMETSLRDDLDRFDLNKARRCLDIAEMFAPYEAWVE